VMNRGPGGKSPSILTYLFFYVWGNIYCYWTFRRQRLLYCRVLPGNATNNLWALDLIAMYLLEYSPGGTTVSRFTILRHINFNLTLLSGVFFALHWTDFYSRLTLHRWTLNWHPIWMWTHLELNCLIWNSPRLELNYIEYYQCRAI
jgi:hypothetical protein